MSRLNAASIDSRASRLETGPHEWPCFLVLNLFCRFKMDEAKKKNALGKKRSRSKGVRLSFYYWEPFPFY